jgi:glycosyltransferase involved in cell wall biosynthesis
MRIAFVSTILDYPLGGADTLWTHAAGAAARRGDRLLVAVSSTVAQHAAVRALNAETFLRAHPVVPVSLADRVVGKLRRLIRPLDPVAGALERFHPDLVVFSLGGTYDLVTAPGWCEWLASFGIPFRLIANYQDENPALDPDQLERARRFFPRADRVYFVSSRNLEVTRRHLALPLANAVVVQNPLRWIPADVSPWPGEEVLSLAAVARLEPVKGVRRLLTAAARQLGAAPGWRLQIYGRGPEEAELRRLAADSGIGSAVVFRGYVRELGAIWAENHMLVSPSVEDGVPMTIPEAMLCARPVLATPVGGAPDWIRNDSNGILCSAASEEALARALGGAWESRARWRAMGEQASRDASARYRPEDYLRLVQGAG